MSYLTRGVLPATVVVIGLLGCGASGPRAAEPSIASAWRARCGTCHARVEPGEKTIAQLKVVTKSHEKRVRFTPDQWDALVTWLGR